MIFNCPECGKEISTESEFCPNCGVPIKAKKTKVRTSSFVMVFFIITVLLLSVLVVFDFTKNKSMFISATTDSETIAATVPSDADKFEVGSESELFPVGAEQLSFGSGDKSVCICSKITPLSGDYYVLEFTVPMLSNASAVGTYSATISYTVKNGDVINMRDYSSYYSRKKELKILYLAPNICYYEIR